MVAVFYGRRNAVSAVLGMTTCSPRSTVAHRRANAGRLLVLAGAMAGLLATIALPTAFGGESLPVVPTRVTDATLGASRRGSGDNVLIIIADDLGVDVLECYGEGSTFPPTPTIDALRTDGVLFRNAYSNTLCTPTRATIQAGRYGVRTGVGWQVRPDWQARPVAHRERLERKAQ